MKYDPLEKFMEEHREEFDDLMPREDLFSGIKTRKAPKKTVFLQVFLRSVAAILIFTVGFYAHDYYSNYSMNKIVRQQNNQLDSTYREFYEMQAYYTSQIDQVKSEILLLSSSDSGISNEVSLELEELNEIFKELQNDLDDQTNDIDVIEAMIMNYRVKLKMLEEMKAQLEPNQKYNEEENDETFDI